MSLSAPRPTPARVSASEDPPPSRLGRTRRQRQWTVAGLGLAVIAAGGIASAVAFRTLSGQHSVLLADRDLATGHVLVAGDLRIVQAGGEVSFVPQSSEADVLGHPLARALIAGDPITAQDVARGQTTAGGDRAQVGVLLKDGQFPPQLEVGAHVRVVDAGSSAVPTTGNSAAPILDHPVSAVVLHVDRPNSSVASGTVVTLGINPADLSGIARAAAAGQIDLALVSPGG